MDEPASQQWKSKLPNSAHETPRSEPHFQG